MSAPFEPGPGLLVVFAQTGANCTEQEFHEWYDDEHIPLRLSTLEPFATAARYVAIPHDPSQAPSEINPKFVAVYTISDNTIFGEERYTKLRANRSEREASVVKRLERLDRRIYKQTSSTATNPSPSEPNAPFVLFDSFTPSPSASTSEYTALLESLEHRFSAIPGFIRFRQVEGVDYVVSGMGTKEGDKDAIPKTLLYIEFSSDPFSHSEWQSLKAWFDQALEPFIVPGQRETRAFKLWKEYEPTAALKAGPAAK